MKLGLLLLSSLAVSLFAQNPPADAAPPGAKCSVKGRVLNSVTAEPIRKAELQLYEIPAAPPSSGPVTTSMPALENARAYTATTDGEGRFLFAGVAPGRYQLAAHRSGFRVQRYGARQRVSGEPILLSEDVPSREIALRMVPLGVIAGRIVDLEGDPVPGVFVTAAAYDYSDRGRHLQARATATTSDLGEYRLFDLEPGRYYVHARPPGLLSRSPALSPAPLALTATFYPAGSDLANARPLDLGAGQQLTSVDLVLHPARTANLRGRVISPAGATNAFVVIQAPSSLNSPVEGVVATAAEGAFVMKGVSPGAYVLRAQCMVDDEQYVVQLPVQVGDSNLEGLELRPLPPVDLPGRLKIEGKTPLRPSKLQLFAQSGDPDSPGFASYSAAAVKDDGTFVFHNLSSGVYRIRISATEIFYVKSIRLGDTDVSESGLDPRERGAAELTFVIGTDVAQIEGSVVDAGSESIPPAALTLVPVSALSLVSSPEKASPEKARRAFRTVSTRDSKGNFVIRSVAPGTYKLFAWDSIESPYAMLYDPDLLKPFASMATTVQVSEGETKTVQVKLIRRPGEP